MYKHLLTLFLIAFTAIYLPAQLTTKPDNIPLKLRVGDKLEVLENGWFVSNARMNFYRDIHRYFRDSMPDLLVIRNEYQLLIENQEKDYMTLRDELMKSQIQSKKVLRSLSSVLDETKINFLESQTTLQASLLNVEQLEKLYRKSNKKGFKSFIKNMGFIGIGVGIGILLKTNPI